MIGYDTVFAWMALISLVLVPLILILRPAAPTASETIEVHPE
jgi:hypothetical protein